MEALQPRTIGQVLHQMVRSKMTAETKECAEHGDFVDYLTPAGWAGCPTCHERGLAARHELRVEGMRQAAREQRAQDLRGRAAIPPRFEDRRLSTFIPHCDGAAAALAIALDYARRFEDRRSSGSSLIFCGTVGSGKTHLAVGIAHEVIAGDRSAVFSSVIDAIRTVKSTYSRDSEVTETQAIDAFVSPDLLILDEVGVQFGTKTEEQILFEIINGRYQQMRPTIVISNLDTIGIEEYLGARSFDRLRENGGRVIPFEWPSYRRQAA